MAGRKLLIVSLIALPTLSCRSAPASAPHASEPGAPLQMTTETIDGPAVGTRGMVSTANPLATAAGLDVLRAGGNAFDAAVAIAATLNVVEPMNSGVGGYGTILVWDAKAGHARFLNSSGRIPAGVDSDAFRAPTPGTSRTAGAPRRSPPPATSTPGRRCGRSVAADPGRSSSRRRSASPRTASRSPRRPRK